MAVKFALNSSDDTFVTFKDNSNLKQFLHLKAGLGSRGYSFRQVSEKTLLFCSHASLTFTDFDHSERCDQEGKYVRP